MRIFEEERDASLESASWLRKALRRRLGEFRIAPEIIDDFQLVVSEICANAVQHAEPKPSRLTLSVDLIGAELILEIEDDGGPFADRAEEAQAAARPSLSLDERGRGLGLVRAALDRMERFSDQTNHFIGRRSLIRKRPTALVVEDTPTLLDFYSDALGGDYRVVRAESLEQARAALKNSQIDIILSDVHLGDGLGVSLPQESADGAEGQAPPVILISADASPETRDTAFRGGAEFFLGKPVRPKALREALRLALARAATREARLAGRFSREVDALLTSPPPARLGPYLLAGAAGSASAGGGDLVLCLPRQGGGRIVMLDVVGHGVGARAWAIAYAAIIRTLHFTGRDLPAAGFLDLLAHMCWEEPALEKALATFLVLDLDGEDMEIALAGHPPPLILGANVFRPQSLNPLLGVLPPTPSRSERVTLKAGERMVLFTDGIDPADVAAGDAPPPWFMEAAAPRQGANPGQAESLDEAAARLREATEATLGPLPPDDWTFLLIERAAN